MVNVGVALVNVIITVINVMIAVVNVVIDVVYSFSYSIAEIIVIADTDEDDDENVDSTVIRKVQLAVVYPAMIAMTLLVVCMWNKDITIPQECTFSECQHYTVDSWGNYEKEAYWDCDIHGHDCPQED